MLIYRAWRARTVAALVLALGIVLAAAHTSRAATTVTGDDSPATPLVIQPDSGERIDDANQMVFFIARMPTTKTINRVTLGDLAQSAGCTMASPWYTLTIREHPSEAIASWTSDANWKAESLEFAVFDTQLQKRTWRIPPTTLQKGRGYSFWVNGYFTGAGCASAKVRSWPHNAQHVNAGPNRCDQVSPSAHRMRHGSGLNDAVVCASASIPSGFDPSMPQGWLSVYNYGTSSLVEVLRAKGTTVPTNCRGYAFGARAVYWRPWPGTPGWHEYVCTWTPAASQFPDYLDPADPSYPNDPADGWYYGFGYTSIKAGGPRDLYMKLDLDEADLAKTYRPYLLFDDDEHWRPLDVRSFLAESYPAASYSTHHRICTLDDSICEEISNADDLNSYDDSNWYLNVTSLASSDADEQESDYVTPGCATGVLRDCDGGATNALYYDVTRPLTDDGYTFIDYWEFYRYDDKDDSHEIDNDHEADLEGMTVAPSKGRPGTFDFASFAQHGTWWAYLRENLECPDTADDTCPDEPNKAGARINAYVATGSHASYPDACSNIVIPTCGKNGQPEYKWEADHDGDAPWAANDDASVLKPEDPDFWWWPGAWGEDHDSGVLSPGYRSHQVAPRDGRCAENNDGCLTGILGARVHPGASGSASRRNAWISRCRPWFGASVAALGCAPHGLRRAVEEQALGGKPTFAIVRLPRASASRRFGGRRRAASAPAITQLLGRPLRPGEGLTVSGRTPHGTLILLRTGQRHRVCETRLNVSRRVGRFEFRVRRGKRCPAVLSVGRRGERSIQERLLRRAVEAAD
jgi:hypothetical protein